MCVFCQGGPIAGIVGNRPLCAHCWGVYQNLREGENLRFSAKLKQLEDQERDLRNRMKVWALEHA